MTNDYSLSDVAAITSDRSGFGGGSSAWILILLFAMIYGWGNGGFGANNGAVAATTADIQRAVDLNSIQQGQANISADIQRGIYEINGATKDAAYNNLSEIRDIQSSIAVGNGNIINQLQNGFANMQTCCCETQRAIDGVNYNAAINTAAINANTNAAVQNLKDYMIAQHDADLRDANMRNYIDASMAGVVRYPMASTYNSGMNPFCNCGNVYSPM
jgi:hypothetical protein